MPLFQSANPRNLKKGRLGLRLFLRPGQQFALGGIHAALRLAP